MSMSLNRRSTPRRASLMVLLPSTIFGFNYEIVRSIDGGFSWATAHPTGLSIIASGDGGVTWEALGNK